MSYLVDVATVKLYTLEELGELIGLKLSTMKKRRTDGLVPESIFVCGVEVYPTPLINEYILNTNPLLLEKMANATLLQQAAATVEGA